MAPKHRRQADRQPFADTIPKAPRSLGAGAGVVDQAQALGGQRQLGLQRRFERQQPFTLCPHPGCLQALERARPTQRRVDARARLLQAQAQILGRAVVLATRERLQLALGFLRLVAQELDVDATQPYLEQLTRLGAVDEQALGRQQLIFRRLGFAARQANFGANQRDSRPEMAQFGQPRLSFQPAQRLFRALERADLRVQVGAVVFERQLGAGARAGARERHAALVVTERFSPQASLLLGPYRG